MDQAQWKALMDYIDFSNLTLCKILAVLEEIRDSVNADLTEKPNDDNGHACCTHNGEICSYHQDCTDEQKRRGLEKRICDGHEWEAVNDDNLSRCRKCGEQVQG